MSTIDRASLPQEFFDITSPLLLKQPEPAYIYARLFLDAMVMSPPSVDSLGRPNDSFGMTGPSYQTLDEQMAKVEKNLLRDAFIFVQEIGKKPGHTVRLNRPAYTNSTYTLGAREVPSGSTISTTGLAVSSEQVSLTLKRYCGPYGASAVQPYSIERFGADLSIHAMAKIVDLHLVRDFHRWLQYVIATLLDASSTTNNVFPGNKTATTDFNAIGDGPMSWDMVVKAARVLADANIPVFPGTGRYAMVLNPRQIEQLSIDPGYERLAKFQQEYNSLFQGSYVATAGDFDIFRTTALNTGTNTTPNPDVTYYKGHAFGPGVLGAGVGDMPRVARSNNDNYGETDLVIWLLYMAISLMDSRFGAVIYTD